MNQTPYVTRRNFLQTASLAAVSLAAGGCLNRVSGSRAKSSEARNIVRGRKLRIAGVGVGGKGHSDIMSCAQLGEDVVALCDVDFVRGRRAFSELPQAARYRDFRQMLREMDKQIDAVVISTTDHMHFPIALMAIEMGKHVYVQKPLTHTIEEARLLKAAAARMGVVTQMGNQGHANEGTRLTKEWIDAGVIGTVREAHIWTNRPVWPQGVPFPETAATPETIDWNLWLGVAPERPFSPDVAPFKWRGFWDYGCGALGDMGCHLLDPAFWVLDLRGDVVVSAQSEGASDVCAPTSSVVTYNFPQRGQRAPVKIVWYDGKKMPPVPKELGPEGQLPTNGSYFIGDKGVIYNPTTYNESPRLIPEERMSEFLQSPNRPKRTIPRVPKSNPYLEWINACKGEGPAPGSNIVDHAADLTEFTLLGNLAIRGGAPIRWNADKMRCDGAPEMDRFIRKPYRVF